MRWKLAADDVSGSRTDNASRSDPRYGDASRTPAGSERSGPGRTVAPAVPPESTPDGTDTDGREGGRDRPGANREDTRKTSRSRWQKSEALGYNANRFMHTLVLPSRRPKHRPVGRGFFMRHAPPTRRPLPQPRLPVVSSQPRLLPVFTHLNSCLKKEHSHLLLSSSHPAPLGQPIRATPGQSCRAA